ncbi:MAG: SAM-dependent methyltransferase [Kofleriaceae bacterium]
MRLHLVLGLGLSIASLACRSKAPATSGVDPANIVAAVDRTAKDRELDASRKPIETLSFFGLAPGMRVADLGAGAGYTTELVARAVGPTGKVFAQDSPDWDGAWLKKAWQDRLARPALANTTHVMRQWNAPLPPEATNLDAVTFVCAYHDVLAEKLDPHALDAAVFAALKPGGTFVIIDNSAKDGSGATDAETLHRIDERLVRADLEQAGFVRVAEASFLRNPADGRDWNADPGADPRTRTQDRFVLKYKKP